MSSAILKLLAAVTIQVGAHAHDPSLGKCEYTSDRPGAAGLSYCTHVANEALCAAEAERKAGSKEWLARHPAKFTPGGDCTDGGKAFKKAGAKKSQKQ
jgi:hypothetical protein